VLPWSKKKYKKKGYDSLWLINGALEMMHHDILLFLFCEKRFHLLLTRIEKQTTISFHVSGMLSKK